MRRTGTDTAAAVVLCLLAVGAFLAYWFYCRRQNTEVKLTQRLEFEREEASRNMFAMENNPLAIAAVQNQIFVVSGGNGGDEYVDDGYTDQGAHDGEPPATGSNGARPHQTGTASNGGIIYAIPFDENATGSTGARPHQTAAASELGTIYSIPFDEDGNDAEGYAVPNPGSYNGAVPGEHARLDLEGYVADDAAPSQSTGAGGTVYAMYTSPTRTEPASAGVHTDPVNGSHSAV